MTYPVQTAILEGAACQIGAARTYESGGVFARLATVRISEPLAYRQSSTQHLINTPLLIQGRASKARRGPLTFTPGGRERHQTVGRGIIVGLEIALDDAFIRDACERTGPMRWREARAAEDAKALACTASIAELLSAQQSDALQIETALRAVARHIGVVYGGADKRRDDAWLHPAALRRVIEQVRASPDGAVSVGDMAREAGLGVSAFLRAFRGALGVTPAKYMLRLRLERAEALLCENASVAEVAGRCGFNSPAHFVYAFRQQRGVTPGHWRREHRRARR